MKTLTKLREIKYEKEDTMLADFVTWAKNTYPPLRYLLFHVANEGKKNPAQAAMDTAKGVTPGVPDVIFIVGPIVGEFKLPSGRYSEKQLKIREEWHKRDIKIYHIENLEQFEGYLFICNEKLLNKGFQGFL